MTDDKADKLRRMQAYTELMEYIEEGDRFYICNYLWGTLDNNYPELWCQRPIDSCDVPWFPQTAEGMRKRYDLLAQAILLIFL